MEASARPDEVQLRVPAVLGNSAGDGWSARLRAAHVDVLMLNAAEAQRSRFRKRTASGLDVIIALERGDQLRDGDILDWDGTRRTAVVVRVDLPDVMVVDLSALLAGPAETLLARSVEIGHALGNQHWPALVKGARVYVPVTVDPKVLATVLRTHGIEGISTSFTSGAEIRQQLAPHEARLLFTGQAGHSHQPAGTAFEDNR